MKTYKVKNLFVADIQNSILKKPLIVRRQPFFKRLIANMFDFDYDTYKAIGTNAPVWVDHRDLLAITYYLSKEQMKKKMTLEELLNWREEYDFSTPPKTNKKIGF